MNPAIVIVAYNRPHALRRLLDCLARADYPALSIPLVISIDSGGSQHSQVREAAESFQWVQGEKRVIAHDKHLGIVGHFMFSGDLTAEYGSVIRLEDDYNVSPVFYAYAYQALAAHDSDARIAGISLYSLWFNGFTHHPFMPLLDDGDCFFLQLPWSQGQAYARQQWETFRSWQSAGDRPTLPDDLLHEMFSRFPADDWFPLQAKYLVETNKYYVFPRQSLSTNFGDAGTHFGRRSDFFQTPLQYQRTQYRLPSLDESLAVYDSFFELLPDRLNRLTNRLSGYQYTVDLNGGKSRAKFRAEYALTSRPCRSPVLSFGNAMWPLEANVIENVPGSGIYFGKVSDLDFGWLATLTMQKSNFEFFTRRRAPGLRTRIKFWLIGLFDRLFGRKCAGS